MMAKKKMTEAQLKALEALEAFEAVTGAVEEEEISPAEEEKRKKREEKRAKKAAKKNAEEGIVAGDSEVSADADGEAPADNSVPVNGKKKKGKMSDAQLRALEAVEAFETQQVGDDVNGQKDDDVVSKQDTKKNEEEEKSESAGVAAITSQVEAFGGAELDFLGLDDSGGRPKISKKKQGKKEKKGSKGAAESVLGEGADEMSLGDGVATKEAKAKTGRPSAGRVRIDSNVQPGYVRLALEKVSVVFKNQDVLTDASWAVQTGDRVGLVGANGGGKTTQLRILSGDLEPTTGEVVKSSADLKLGFLRQEFVDELVVTRTLKEELMSVFTEEAQIMADLESCETDLEAAGSDMDAMQVVLDKMTKLQKAADQKGVKTLSSRAERIMNIMGFTPEEGEQLVASFSGGWKMRIGLGKILLTEPNILLLDEPTNHLDLESIEWMEDFLINQKIPMVIVSHDREFLDRVCTKTVDCDMGVTYSYDVAYSKFQQQKKERLAQWTKSYEIQMKKVKSEKDWINKFKIGAQAPQAASRQTKLEKWQASADWVQRPPTPGKPLRFRFPDAPRMGNAEAICDVRSVRHGYPDSVGKEELFKDVNLVVEKGERLALIGPNGCGKSTLMRLVVGKETMLDGTIVLGGGDKLLTNYYEQNQADVLDLEKSVIETIKDAADGQYEYEQLRALLGQFLFKGDTVDKKLESLSGGEKARVALCRMMLQPANLLVLDEPTNHLDIPAKEMLEEALKLYDGTLLVISHDRYFISQVANTIAAFEDKTLVRYNGDYKFFMDSNAKLAQKVESRYMEGGDQIRNCIELERPDEQQTKKRNFGGSAVTSGNKNKGVKNAKRQGD